MDTSLLIENIKKHIILEPSAEQYFISLLQEKKIKRKEFLLHAGEVCHCTAYVLSGCLRLYSLDLNGFEHIIQFAPRGWWVADIHSLISKQPSKLSIDALEDSQVLLLERDDQELLFSKYPVFERFFRILIEHSVASQHNRLTDYLSLSAQERYEAFCQRYPSLMQTLPQKQIASYIGVTPEFLSKMRSNLVRKKS
jgi:CRP-like cAMP-binding protein